MSASRSIACEDSPPKVVSLAANQKNESSVSSCVMAYFSSTGQFRFECDFKNPVERAALILHLQVALDHLHSRVSAQITPSLNLAA